MVLPPLFLKLICGEKKRGKAFQYSSGKHISGWAEIQMLIQRDSFWEVMDEMVPQMLAVISPHNTVK